MNFTIVIQGGPYSSQASLSALNFARAVIRGGHSIRRLFFYNDGVYNANRAISPPQDEQDLHQAWHQFATDNSLEIIICVASALRRGMLDSGEASRYEKQEAVVAESFEISGLGQLIDGCLNADRVITFGP